MKKFVSIVCLLAFVALMFSGCKSGEYDKGVKLQEEGKYSEAVSVFEGIDDYQNYKDTADRIEDCNAMIAAIDKYDTSKNRLSKRTLHLIKL